MDKFENTGFGDDNFEGEKFFGLFLGQVVRVENDPDDPETQNMDQLGRVKFFIQGFIEPESAWAFPFGAGGSAKWGRQFVPPKGADVYVMFVNGEIDHPVWAPGYHGIPIVDGEPAPEGFPEFVSKDVAVGGIGPFRIVIDNTEGQKQATIKTVKEVNGVEEALCEIVLDADNNSVLIRGTRLVRIEADGMVDIDAPQVQIKGRVVMPTTRPIS
jgi:uncharacterized protein involved in type VI secretion and phage assembly